MEYTIVYKIAWPDGDEWIVFDATFTSYDEARDYIDAYCSEEWRAYGEFAK